MPRCYVPDAGTCAGTAALPPGEAHHVTHVMRLGDGAAVRVFDGRGQEWHARLSRESKDRLVAILGDRAEPAPEPPVHITLAQAVLKAEYMDAAVRDACMMGVAAIQPLSSSRSVVGVDAGRATRLVGRWQRIAVASVKQCGRAVVPLVHDPRPLDRWLPSAGAAALKLLLVEPAARPRGGRDPDLHEWSAIARGAGAVVLVGPEGGWTSHEIDVALETGFIPWTVSPRTLRADAVSVAALSVLLYAWERPSTSATQSSSS